MATRVATKQQLHEMKEARMRAFAAYYCLSFAQHSLDPSDRGAVEKTTREAAGVLGISIRTASSWMRHPVVANHIKETLEKATAKYQLKADDILDEVATLAFADIKNYFRESPRGLEIKSLSEMGNLTRAIKRIKYTQKITRNTDEDNPQETVENNYELELWSKEAMLKVLAQFHKLIDRAKEHGVNPIENGGTVIILPDNGSGGKLTLEYQKMQEIPYEEVK